jgi:hypothetical protein
MSATDAHVGRFSAYPPVRGGSTIAVTTKANDQEVGLMKRRSWIVIGSLTGAVASPALVAIAAVLVHDLREPVFDDQGVPALLICGAAGILIGGFVASRVASMTSQRMAFLGAVCGSILGAATMGSLFLAIEVATADWPLGLSAFVTGSLIGAVVGGFLGGVIGSVQVDPRTVDQGHALGSGSASAATSLRDVR